MTVATRTISSLLLVISTPVDAQRMTAVVDTRAMSSSIEAPAAKAKGPLDWPARLSVDGVPLESGLQKLHERSGVAIAFSSSVLPDNRSVTCFCSEVTVGQALSIMLEGLNLQAAEMEGDIVLISRAPSGTSIPLDMVADANRSVTGRLAAERRAGRIIGQVTNAASGQPIPSVQVSIDGPDHEVRR